MICLWESQNNITLDGICTIRTHLPLLYLNREKQTVPLYFINDLLLFILIVHLLCNLQTASPKVPRLI